MSERLTPPDWSTLNPDMLLNVGDARYYYESFTEVVDNQAHENKLGIGDLDGRVTALEHSTPVGPGGDGAYLHLGGTPERYPTLTEMSDGDTKDVTSFMVIARNDGIYFYNPKTKVVIPPKKNGGTIAVHGQFPQIFDAGHTHEHEGRAGLSGVYTAKVAEVGLGTHFTNFDTCTMLVVVNAAGEEYQTAYSPDGMASRIFRAGLQVAHWGVNSGGGGGGGSGVDPIVIQEIKDRLDALETHTHIDEIVKLKDVDLDHVLDADGLIYMDETGRVKGGSTNPLLTEGSTHVHVNSVGAPPVISGANISSSVVARNNVVIFKGTLAKQVQLPGVVAHNTFKPASNQVREGRTTFIVNSSDVNLTVKVSAGGMFYVEGNMDSTDAVVPPKTVFVYNPALIDNGSGAITMCWIYMGNYQLRATDLSAITQEVDAIKTAHTTLVADLKAGHNTLIDSKALGTQVYTGWNTVWADDAAKYEHVVFWGTSTNRGLFLPDIVAHNTDTIADKGVVRVGRTITITNRGTVDKFVWAQHEATIWRSEADLSLTEFTVSPGYTVVLTAMRNGSAKYWVLLGSYDMGLKPGSIDLKEGLQNGGQLVNWNSIGADPVSTSGDVTSANVASSPFCVGMGTSTGKKFIMAEIVDRAVASLTSTQVREGRTTYLINMNTVARSVELTGGAKFNMTGTLITTKQTIPAKTVWMFTPGIYSNGDKVWTFSGSFSSEAIDYKDLVSRVDALEAGGGPGSGGVTEFVGLTDTPANYNGQKNKFLAVKDDESGVEFVTTPSIDTKPIEDRLDLLDQNIAGHVADFELMRDGHIPTSWNGLGARPITTSNDITVADLAESPFCIGTGTVAGKKFILPDIAELGVMSLGAGQVREGRATYLINFGNVDRTIEVTSGCKINVTGGAVTTPKVIPRRTTWVLSPGVFAGDKVWMFMGALSAENLDIVALVDRLSALESRPVTEKFTDLTDTPNDYRPGQVLRYNQAGTAVTSSEFALKHLTDTPSDYAGQKGKMLVVNNGETAMEFSTIPDHSGMETDINNNHNSIITIQNEQTIQNQQIEIAKKPVSSIVEYKTYTTSNNVQSSSIGDQDVVIQELLTSSNPIIWLPTIVERTTTPTSSQCWVGKRYSFLNRGEVDTVIKTPGTGGTIALPDRTTATNLTLKKGHSADFVTAGTGTAGVWVLVRIGPIDDTVVATGGGDVTDYETGNALLHQNSLGGPTVLSGEQVISGSLVASSAMVLVSAWQDSGFVNMPKITAHTTNPLPADHVRAGRVTSIYNRSGNSKSITIRPDPAWTATIKMKNKTYANITNFVLGPGKVAKFTPLIDAGVQYWALIEEYTF